MKQRDGATSELSVDQVIEEATRNGRVCPRPKQWHRLYKVLPKRMGAAGVVEPPAPLILAAWHFSSDLEKRERLRQHLDWAAKHDRLTEIAALLASLREDQWLHMED